MMRLAHPTFLWALAALTVPLAIHLLNRKEGKIILLGSLRHLQASPTKQFSSIRLNELVLLALRSLLILLLVLFISGIQWNSLFDAPKKRVLLEKGLERDARLQATIDSLRYKGYEAGYLSPGFPFLKDSSQAYDVTDYWGLVEQLASEKFADVFVFARNRAEDFHGKRIPLPPNIHWVTQEPGAVDYPLEATRLQHDSLQIRIGHSQSAQTNFENNRVSISGGRRYFKLTNMSKDSVLIRPPDTLSIQLVSDQNFSYDREIILAALRAIQQTLIVKLIISEGQPSGWNKEARGDWLFWLSNLPAPQGKIKSKVGFMLKNSSPLLIRANSNEWQFTQRLNEKTALEENLSLQLLTMLAPGATQRQVARSKDRRTLSSSLAWSAAGTSENGSSATPRETDALYIYVLLLFLLTLVAERVISYLRNQ